MSILLLQAALILPVCCLTDPSGTDNNAKNQDVMAYVLTLEQRLENLQTKSLTQDQKYSALLQSVVSKLASATDELSLLKSELRQKSTELSHLETEHNATKLQLSALLTAMQDKFVNYISSSQANITSLGSHISKLESVKSEVETLRDTFNVTITTLTSDASKWKSMDTILKSHISNFTKALTETGNKLLPIEAELHAVKRELVGIKHNVTFQVNNHLARPNGIEGMAVFLLEKNEYAYSEDEIVIAKELTNMQGNCLCRNKPSAVAFQVVQTNDIDFPFNGKPKFIIPLDTTTLNQGGGYNITSGRFTAPVTGIYLFWVHIMSSSQQNNNLSLVKDGQIVAKAENDKSQDVIIIYAMNVKKDEQVWCQSEFAGKRRISVMGSFHSYFGGILIQAVDVVA